jgi:hypothetical protein
VVNADHFKAHAGRGTGDAQANMPDAHDDDMISIG